MARKFVGGVTQGSSTLSTADSMTSMPTLSIPFKNSADTGSRSHAVRTGVRRGRRFFAAALVCAALIAPTGSNTAIATAAMFGTSVSDEIVPNWSPDEVYRAGDRVRHNGSIWEVITGYNHVGNWEVPGQNSHPRGPWMEEGRFHSEIDGYIVREWTRSWRYVSGDIVHYNGKIWQVVAGFPYLRDVPPSTDWGPGSPWREIGDGGDGGTLPENPDTVTPTVPPTIPPLPGPSQPPVTPAPPVDPGAPVLPSVPPLIPPTLPGPSQPPVTPAPPVDPGAPVLPSVPPLIPPTLPGPSQPPVTPVPPVDPGAPVLPSVPPIIPPDLVPDTNTPEVDVIYPSDPEGNTPEIDVSYPGNPDTNLPEVDIEYPGDPDGNLPEVDIEYPSDPDTNTPEVDIVNPEIPGPIPPVVPPVPPVDPPTPGPGGPGLPGVPAEPPLEDETDRPCRHEILVGETLRRGESLTSCNGRFFMRLQEDGNLVIYRRNPGGSWTALAATMVFGDGPLTLALQEDGNLVKYRGTELTAENAVAFTGILDGAVRAVLQDDGNFVVRAADGTALWALFGLGEDSNAGYRVLEGEVTNGGKLVRF